jgi:hypothetical protein
MKCLVGGGGGELVLRGRRGGEGRQRQGGERGKKETGGRGISRQNLVLRAALLKTVSRPPDPVRFT